MKLVWVLLLLTLHTSLAQAWTEKALESSDPFVFKPNELSLEHFSLQTQLKWAWIPGSFEWVRIDHHFLVPRARVKIELPPSTPVLYHHQVFLSTLSSVEIPISLTQEKGNTLEISGKIIPIRFKANPALPHPLTIDATCSSAPLQFKNLNLKHSWVAIYCHAVHPQKEKGSAYRIDVDLFWESESSRTIQVNHFELPSADGLTQSIAFTHDTPTLKLERGEDSFEIHASVPETFHSVAMSIGMGPYLNQETWRPFATLYASYFFNEQMKLASFVALPVKKTPEVDIGLYIISEQFRGLDERLGVNLLLGAHTLSFYAARNHFFKLSIPQGVELIFKDFLQAGPSLMIGGFFYPLIADRSYVNTWIRYGNAKLFLEFNFIQWKEPTPLQIYESKSLGFSLGFPLFRAF